MGPGGGARGIQLSRESFRDGNADGMLTPRGGSVPGNVLSTWRGRREAEGS